MLSQMVHVLQRLNIEPGRDLKTTIALCLLGLLLSAVCILSGTDATLMAMPTD